MLKFQSSPRNVTIILFALAILAQVATAAPAAENPLHQEFDRLLSTYVQDHLVNYDRWLAQTEDVTALDDYIAHLAALDPAEWADKDALAYWLNLYNAATLKLILDNYPLDSIKDLGGFLKKSPWKRKLVTVGDRELTLNEIENDIIRPKFQDPRIHFALNCASIGCPPLADAAYIPAQLSAQLDDACRLALNRDLWVRVEGQKLKLTKIFSWYGDDFKNDGGSVLAFIRRYRTEPMPAGNPELDFMSYDWSLNRTP